MSVNSSQGVSLKTDLEITLPNGLRHYLLQWLITFPVTGRPGRIPSPPRLATGRGRESGCCFRLIPLHSSKHTIGSVWEAFSKPHYLFSVMYNTHRHRLRNVARDARATTFFSLFSPPEDNRLLLRVRKQMQDSCWFVYLTSVWSPDLTDTSSWHRWPQRALSWNALSPFFFFFVVVGIPPPPYILAYCIRKDGWKCHFL